MVLLQQGKGGDMASAFGGGGSQAAFGARAGATVLTKATSILGVLFMIGAIALGVIGKRGEASLMGGYKAPVTNTPAPAPLPGPTTTAPAATPQQQQSPAPAPADAGEGAGEGIRTEEVRPPRESGGTGRRTSLRGWRSQERGGSNPPFRTNSPIVK